MVRRRQFLCLTAAALFPAAALASDKKDDKAAARQEPYVDIPTLTATVVRADGRRGVLTVQAVLYAPNAGQRIKAAKSMPILLNAFVPALQGFAYHLPPGTPPNIDTLSRTLQRGADQVLGPGTRILLGGVLVS